MIPNNIQKYIEERSSIFWTGSDLDKPIQEIPKEFVYKASESICNPRKIYPIDNKKSNSVFSVLDHIGNIYVLKIGLFPSNYSFHAAEWASNQARELGLSTPKILITDTSRYIIPFDFQIQEMADGFSVKELQEKRLKNIDSVLVSLTRSLAKFHQIHLTKFGPLDPTSFFTNTDKRPRGIFESWQKFLMTNFQNHLDECLEIQAINEKQYSKILSFQSQYNIDDFVPTLLHNDLSKDNILVNGDEIKFIDWNDVIIGDPIYDLANLCSFYMPEKFGLIWDTYFHKSKKSKDFERRFWLYYLRIVLARTVHRQKYQILDNPNYPIASNRINIALEKLN